MRLPASLLGLLMVLPACDVAEAAFAAARAEAEPAEAAVAEVEAEAEAEASPTPERAEKTIVAQAPTGLGSDVASAVERARVDTPTAERAPLAEDPTVVVPFSEDASRVEPIRPRKETPRPRVRTRRAPVAAPITPVVAAPKPWTGCGPCGRG